MPYYHYTSRSAAQSIISTGIIRPSSNGFVYLSTEVYATGSAAANALGIINLVEIAFEIPDNPPPHGLSAEYQAAPVTGPAGEVLRLGAGPEVKTSVPITISKDEAKWLTIREP